MKKQWTAVAICVGIALLVGVYIATGLYPSPAVANIGLVVVVALSVLFWGWALRSTPQ